MPELPDVQVYKQYIDATCLHKRIAAVQVLHRAVLAGASAKRLSRSLKNNSFRRTFRHGKNLFAEVTSNCWFWLHFGMTGYLRYHQSCRQLSRHARVVIIFYNGYRLDYICQRLLGRVGLVDSVEDFLQRKQLGVDALRIDFQAFQKILEAGGGSVKATLMNQNKLAGLGNIYTDEILFQSGVDPRRKARELSGREAGIVFENIHKVLKEAIRCKVDPAKMPSFYMIPYRAQTDMCPRCGGYFEKVKLGGRTSYFCSNCQR